MPSKRFLRVLIVANLILIAVGAVVGIVGKAWLPDPLRVFEQSRAADITATDWILFGVSIPMLIALVVASIGLLLFSRPARPLYLAIIIVDILLTPCWGPYVTTGWARALEAVSYIINGVVLALIYFSPLRDLFERPQTGK